MPPPHKTSNAVPETTRQQVQELVDSEGLTHAAHHLGVSRESLLRVLARTGVHAGTAALIERELSKRLERLGHAVAASGAQ